MLDNTIEPLNTKMQKLLVIDLEPTHYKTDLWNAVNQSELIDLFVIYSQQKNWSPDGGHNYLVFPENNYRNIVYKSKGFIDSLKSTFGISKQIFQDRPDVILVYGYAHIQMVCSIFLAIILRKRLLLFVDEFNNKYPAGRFSLFKWVLRKILRIISFRFSESVLVCGENGIKSAKKAGCPEHKIYDFPYVINVSRILSDSPESIPKVCLNDLHRPGYVLFFSGRMIHRKGLPSLLSALSNDVIKGEWLLWIEGDGPELKKYINLAKQYGISERCRFLGFCQYDLHSWLIRSSDIVIVPSLEDNWGIVVDEGLQLGKLVVTSDATGSGLDRIINKHNGFIFPAGDDVALSSILGDLINVNKIYTDIMDAAKSGDKNVTPEDNLNTLLHIIRDK